METKLPQSGRIRASRFALLLGVIVIAAATPRLLEALRNPLVFDEIYAVLLARTGLAGLLGTLANDVDQPLHYILVWLWRGLGGEGTMWIKMLPLIWSLLTVALVAIVGRRLFGAAAGLAGAALLAIQPTHIFYSQMASFHAMVWFLLLAAFFCAWRWTERPTVASAIGFVLSAAAAIYTDHFSYIVTGAIAVWGLATVARTPRRALAWLALVATVFILYLPQLPVLLAQWERDINGERHLPPLGPAEVTDVLRKLAWNASYLVIPFLVLALLPLLRREWRRAVLAMWFVCMAGVIVPWVLSRSGIHLYIGRQMYFILPFWCLLIASGLETIPSRIVRGAALALLLLFGVRAWALRKPSPEAIELPRAVAWLETHARPGETVFCAETRSLLFLEYHLPRIEAKLLIMPRAEAFHFSDGILIVPPEQQVPYATWLRSRGRHEPWWGIRLKHAGRDGAEAATAMSAAGNKVLNLDRVTLWSGSSSVVPPRR